MKHFDAIIVVPLHEIIENIYKLLSHAPGFQSHALFISAVERSATARTNFPLQLTTLTRDCGPTRETCRYEKRNPKPIGNN